MNIQKPLMPPETIACEVCLKEIPCSEAKIVEVDDYVAHFCGLDCYEIWRNEEAKKS